MIVIDSINNNEVLFGHGFGSAKQSLTTKHFKFMSLGVKIL